MDDNKNDLILSIFNNNKSGFKSTENYIKKYFPSQYSEILKHSSKFEKELIWLEKLYLYINSINEIPVCKVCKNPVSFINLKRGYRGCCSIKCLNRCEDKKIKTIKTNLEKYGCENPMQNSVVRKKGEFTNIIKYGDKYPANNVNVKLKMKTTNLKKYGCENPSQFSEFKIKRKKTFLKNYGVEHVLQNNDIYNKLKKTNLIRYGVEFSQQNTVIQEKTINTMIERYGELWLKHIPSYNANSIIYLDTISEILNLPIQHALNGGEKKFVKYWVDGYIEKYNICIEWDEKHHNSTKQKEKDIVREQYLKDNFNCNIIRINEMNFMKDIETGICDICGLINNMIKL